MRMVLSIGSAAVPPLSDAAPLLTGLVLEWEAFIRPTRITWASPDDASNRGTSDLTWTVEDSGRVHVELPPLELWATIVVDFA